MDNSPTRYTGFRDVDWYRVVHGGGGYNATVCRSGSFRYAAARYDHFVNVQPELRWRLLVDYWWTRNQIVFEHAANE